MTRPAPDRYLEDDDKLHKKLITSCDLATQRDPEIEDNEETRSILLHERLLAV